MKITTVYEMIDKAKNKKNGIYSHKGHKYVVANNDVKYVSEGKDIFQLLGSFTVRIGIVEKYMMQDSLKSLLKVVEK